MNEQQRKLLVAKMRYGAQSAGFLLKHKRVKLE